MGVDSFHEIDTPAELVKTPKAEVIKEIDKPAEFSSDTFVKNYKKEVKKLAEAQNISEMVTLAKIKMGELLNELPKATSGNGSNQYQNAEIRTPAKFSKTPKAEVIKNIGLTQKQAERLQTMEKNRTRINPEFILEKKPKEHNIIIYDDIVSTGETLETMRNLLVAEGYICYLVVGIRNKGGGKSG